MMKKMRWESSSVTLVLVNLANTMESADMYLLPSVYRELGRDFHAGPTALGSLTLFRSLVQTLCYPFAAYLATRYNRAHVIALGAFLWAAATFFFAISSTYLQVAISRGLNGIGLAIFIPAVKSLIADSTDDNNRGMAFGWLALTGNIGSIIGVLSSVLIAQTSFAGIRGWRIAFHLVAFISLIISILIRLFANDPNFSRNDSGATHQTQTPHNSMSFCSGMKDLLKEAKSVMKIPSFQVIVAQGIPGSFPWSALSFGILWLELMGFSDVAVALLWSLFIGATAFGALFGGKMGDILSKRLPNTGRIMVSQISTGSAVPLAAILLLALPNDPPTAFKHALVLFITGFSISWSATATNNPIFAEIVPENSRTTIYALDKFLEYMLASFAPPIVGILAERVYGYKIPPDAVEVKPDRKNAASLAKALYTAIGIPMILCCFIYSFLYRTYPRDRERARMVALVDSELQQLEAEDGKDQDDNGDERVLLSR